MADSDERKQDVTGGPSARWRLTGPLPHRGVMAVVLAVLAALVSALPASSATPPAKTRVVIRVDGCASCTLYLARAFSGTDQYWRSRGKRVGADHRVVFRVPAKRTHGMSFELDVPWEDYTGARLNVVTRYAGQRPGESRGARAAKRSAHAFGCWAGTRRGTARLHVRVARFAFTAGDGARSVGAVAWASPGLRSLRPQVDTWHGSIGNQEIFYCS